MQRYQLFFLYDNLYKACREYDNMYQALIFAETKLKQMERLKAELEDYIATGYDFEAMMDLGNGWEPYEGCTNNLMMILEDPDTVVEVISGDSDLYKEGIRRYHITLPSWWRKGSIAISFDESELV